MKKTYYLYRGGGDIIHLLRNALADFRARRRSLPPSVVVHRMMAGQVQEALVTLGVQLPVNSNGGALVGEVWLEEVKGHNDTT